MPLDLAPRVLRIRGAADNNLAGVDLDLPKERWIAVTGPSGSGKTSLVFDTLVREGERRFLGSLAPRARHFFGKLGRSDVRALDGLPATISVGQHAITPNSRSTVGTLTGALDLLRLVFARSATLQGTPLTRSHFSFNHPRGQCPSCSGLGMEDHVDPRKLLADPTRSLRAGALVPTLKSGYTVYSQVTLEVMDQICRAHGFDVDTPWEQLSGKQQHVILYGSRALKVPFGKHPIESRMKWEGITARPREEGYYLGLVPVIEETLKRNRNANILRFVSSGPCAECAGTRLGRIGREASFGGVHLPELLAMDTAELSVRIDDLPDASVWKHVRPRLQERLQRVLRLGLGHLSLARCSTSLSGGEAQRVRLAAQLGTGLSGVLFALDEPTLGLHPESQAGMRAVLDELIDKGNSLVVVEHDPDMVRAADHVLALGPGAGSEGGRLVFTEIPGHPESGPRAADPLGGPAAPRERRRPRRGALVLRGATLHNLDNATLELLHGAFNVIIGPSGAGKSSLIFGTLLPALLGDAGGPFEAIDGIESAKGGSPQAVDARPIGKTPRSTPATWCGLFDIVRKRFAALDDSRSLGLTAGHFSFNNARGRCETCDGLGVTRIGMHLFEDVELECDACHGGRYGSAVLAVQLHGKSIAEVLDLTFREACAFFEHDADAARLCAAMLQLGLGYLTLGQSSGSLSRGEAQRIKLGTLLGSKRARPSVVLLDEPDRGLAPVDVAALLHALDALVDAGHTLVAISHHRHVWAAADRLIEVRNGRTDHAPSIDWQRLSERRPIRSVAPSAQSDARACPTRHPIQLRGVRTHNLKGIDVSFPRDRISAVCGVSGSGKSSLVFDTLVAEAQVRFAESLPFQVRRFTRRLPQPDMGCADGLTPTIGLRQSHGAPGSRSTVATLSECGPLLRLLYSRSGELAGEPCGLSASHFSRERAVGACPHCSGRRTLQRCDPARLVTSPDLPLAPASAKGQGAMTGTRPGRFFTEPAGQHLATLVAALVDRGMGLEDAWVALRTVPWSALPPAVRDLALEGSGGARHSVTWQLASQVEGGGTHAFEATWDGLCALVEREAQSRARSKKAAEWAQPLGQTACPACVGSGLGEAARRTTVRGFHLSELEALPLEELLPALDAGATSEARTTSEVAFEALLPELADKLTGLISLGLGHLNLARRAETLSSGELQRLRLAGVLCSGLSDTTLALDEPGAGLHERDVTALVALLREFQSAGNTVVIVSHRPSLLSAADHLIEIGPGAGAAGGQVVALDAPAPAVEIPASPGLDARRIRVRGAHAHNLARVDFELPLSGLVCITGVSGSGKSSLAFDVLGASFQASAPVLCDSIETPGGFQHFERVHAGRSARSGSGARTALSTLGIAGELAALFASSELPKRAFLRGTPEGRCKTCGGSGREQIAMDFLGDLSLPCQACDGHGFLPEVLRARWRGKSIAALLESPASELLASLEGDPPALSERSRQKLCVALHALEEVALGHLPLGRPRSELSGGEANRVELAANLVQAASPALYVFDEPSTGLHETDLVRITAAFRRLADRGDLVLATEHRLSAIAAADWVIDLGPEGGPYGGQLVDMGPPQGLQHGFTAAALRARSQLRQAHP